MRFLVIVCAIATPAYAQLVNPSIKPVQEPKTETRFGITTSDPYRWMEDPARKAEMIAFVRSTSDATTAQLAKLPQRAAFAETLQAATRAGVRFSDVQAHGDRLFYRRLDPADRTPKLMVRDASGERLVIDPGVGGANAAVGAWSIAPDGRTIAAHVSEKGSERGAVRFIDVATGRETSPRVDPVWGEFEISWLSPTRIAYTKIMPQSGDPMLGMRTFVADLGGGGETAILGAGVAGAPAVEPSEFPLLLNQEGSDWVLGGAVNARADQRYFVARRSDVIAGKPRWRSLSALADQVSNVALHGDDAYLLTSKGASNGRLARRSVATDAGVTTTIATPPGLVLNDVYAANDGVYVTAQADGAARLLFAPHGAAAMREIALPFESDIAGAMTASDGRGLIVTLMGWTTAPRSFRVENGRLAALPLDSVSWAAAKPFVVRRLEAVSADGTKVPLVVVQPPGTGPWPTILEGYGSYGAPTTTPWYNPFLLAWSAKGGATAYCGTRGGNERGRDWHDGGRAANKPNAHADFIACAESLVAAGVARPGAIAAMGTSAGGMLAPIAAQQRPDLFGALLPRVAMLNASRLEAAANGANQYSEMGDPRTAEGYRALVAEDAVLALATAKGLPDRLVTIGLNDQRVAPWMGAKFAATARDRFGDQHLVMVRADAEAGHGVGSTRDVQIDEWADTFAFLADRLAANVRGAAPPTLPMSDVEQAAPVSPAVLPVRDRARFENAVLADRLDTIVPRLMRDHKIDMWVLVAREYFEDPVVATMLNAESLHARRRTILIFFDPGGGKPVERLTVSRYGLGGLFAPAWDPEKQPDQWKQVADLIAARRPATIAINTSSLSAFADGMTYSAYNDLRAALPRSYAERIVSGEPLAIGWLETRTPMEMAAYPGIMRMAHGIIADAFSPKVITPGVTTTEQVVWWYRQRLIDIGLVPWFQPSVGVLRRGEKQMLEGDTVIQPGDLLWTDFGITYLRLNTDTQHLAYVLRDGETQAPAGLRAGLKAANRVQDALLSSFRTGATGNDILAQARAKAIAAGLKPSIYSHPLGYHGHAAGSAIGFWDNQNGDERGRYPLHPDTTWSIELAAYLPVPEWGGQEVQFRSEENAFFDGRQVRFLDGRQTQITLIPGGQGSTRAGK